MDPDSLQREQGEQLLARLRALPDPEERLRAIDAAHDHIVRVAQVELSELRKETILAMLQTMSKSEVARRLGVHRSRIGQLIGTNIHYPAMHRRSATVPSEDS